MSHNIMCCFSHIILMLSPTALAGLLVPFILSLKVKVWTFFQSRDSHITYFYALTQSAFKYVSQIWSYETEEVTAAQKHLEVLNDIVLHRTGEVGEVAHRLRVCPSKWRYCHVIGLITQRVL